MDLAATVKVCSEVMAREVGDEIVLLHLASGTYFGLDPVGARMWQLIGDGNSVGAIYETLLDEYEVAPSELMQDMSRMLDELQARALVSLA